MAEYGISIAIRTWGCPSCDYHQDFEPTADLMALHFRREGGVPAGLCPACYLGKNPTRTRQAVTMQRETRPERKTHCRFARAADIARVEGSYSDLSNAEKADFLSRGKARLREMRDAGLFDEDTSGVDLGELGA